MQPDRFVSTRLAQCAAVATALAGVISCSQDLRPREAGPDNTNLATDPVERLVMPLDRAAAEAKELAGRKPSERLLFAGLTLP